MNAMSPSYSMYSDLMRYVAGQFADGEVERREFVPTTATGSWPIVPDATERKRVEEYVLKNTPSAHRFIGNDGETRIVFFDERGRAADAKLSQISDNDLIRIARRCGMKIGADNNDEPTTSRTDHGYRKPVQEAKAPKPKFRIGDMVSDLDGGRPGKIDYIGDYDEEMPGYRYKVKTEDGQRKFRNETGLKKIGK